MSTIKADTIVASDGTSPVTLTKQSAAKAWFNYDQSANSVRDSINTSSFSDDSTGDFKANLTSAMSDANYPAVGSTFDSTTATVDGVMWLCGHDDSGTTPGVFTSSQCRFGAYYYTTNRIDATRNRVIIHGDLA